VLNIRIIRTRLVLVNDLGVLIVLGWEGCLGVRAPTSCDTCCANDLIYTR
jgi:hypothetical protein